jgi:uncharacterized RDD family membrane protein YckC
MTYPGQSDPQPDPGGWGPQPASQPGPHPASQPGPQPVSQPGPQAWSQPYPTGLVAHNYGPQLRFPIPPGSELASVGRRIGGYFLELLLLVLTLGLGYLIWALVVWARGQTPGKQLLGMYCYRPATASIASWGFMLLRWFGQVLESLIPFGFVITSIMMITSDERRAIHDHVAGTVVLHRK